MTKIQAFDSHGPMKRESSLDDAYESGTAWICPKCKLKTFIVTRGQNIVIFMNDMRRKVWVEGYGN